MTVGGSSPRIPDQSLERPIPAMPRVHVDDHDAGFRSGRNADVGVRVFLPPAFDLLLVSRGVIHAVACSGMLAGVFALRVTATAFPVSDAMKGEDSKPQLSVGQGVFERVGL